MNRTIRQLLLPTAFVVLAILMPAQASASVLAVEQDCADSDVFEHKHSPQDLRDALTQIQADLAEYGTCRQMINAALAAMAKTDASNNSNDGDGPGATAADLNGDGVVTPNEKAVAAKKAKQKQKQRNKEIAAISDDLVQDDAASAGDSGSGGPSLPLILAIVALLCAGIGGGVWYAAKRNPAFANALRRVASPFGNS
jgi:hypothetical protein